MATRFCVIFDTGNQSYRHGVQRRHSMRPHHQFESRVARLSPPHCASVVPSRSHAAWSRTWLREKVHPVDGHRSAVCVSDVRGLRSTCPCPPADRAASRWSLGSSRSGHVHDTASVAGRPIQSLLLDVLRKRGWQPLLQTSTERHAGWCSETRIRLQRLQTQHRCCYYYRRHRSITGSADLVMWQRASADQRRQSRPHRSDGDDQSEWISRISQRFGLT